MSNPTDWEQRQIAEPIVRDVMAIERTIMANERTFLAFWRTALTMFIAGLTFLQFFAGTVMQIIGWIFIPTGVVVFLQGLKIYRRMNAVIRRAEQAVDKETEKGKS
jgi:putative membrane protein